MKAIKKSSSFQNAIETIEALPLDEQVMVLEIIRHRLIQQRRADLIGQVAEARRAYSSGQAQRGKVADLLAELDS